MAAYVVTYSPTLGTFEIDVAPSAAQRAQLRKGGFVLEPGSREGTYHVGASSVTARGSVEKLFIDAGHTITFTAIT